MSNFIYIKPPTRRHNFKLYFFTTTSEMSLRRTDTHYFFYPASKLSPFYKCTFVEDGIEYASAEHYTQYQQAVLFKDEARAAIILGCDDPYRVKRTGRRVTNFDEDVWREKWAEIVMKGTRLKFEQNPSLLGALSDTGTRTIVEASNTDSIWGGGT